MSKKYDRYTHVVGGVFTPLIAVRVKACEMHKREYPAEYFCNDIRNDLGLECESRGIYIEEKTGDYIFSYAVST